MPPGPNVLDYAPPSDRPSRWRTCPQWLFARWRRIPLPIAAILLLVPAAFLLYRARYDLPSQASSPLLVGMYAMTPVFLAVGIRGGRWRDILMAPLFVASAAWLPEMMSKAIPDGLHIYWWLARDGIPILVLGIAAWCASERRTKSAFAWMLVAAIGAAAFDGLFADLIRFSDESISDPAAWRFAADRYDNIWLFHPVFWAFWTAAASAWISWGLRAARGRLRSRVAFASAALGVSAIYAIAFGPAIVPLARLSTRGYGPFGKTYVAWIIEMAGTARDTDYLYDALDQCGWNVQGSPGAERWGWENASFHAITVRDPARLADRLSRRLLTAPNARLAEAWAPFLAAQHRYETVPILIRYALIERAEYRGPSATKDVVQALEDMRIPHVALAVMVDVSVELGRRSGNATFHASAIDQQRLKRLLHVDAGDDLDKWAHLCWRASKSAPSPLPPDLQADANMTLDSILKYAKAQSQLKRSGRRGLSVLLPNFNVPTTQQFVREVDAYADRVAKAVAPPLPPPG